MFQFRRFPTYGYLIHHTLIRYCRTGFPHSEISGSKLMCSSPKLIAAYHVLHRLLMPRHSPCALLRLTFLIAWFSNYASSIKKFSWLIVITLKIILYCCLLIISSSFSVQFSRYNRVFSDSSKHHSPCGACISHKKMLGLSGLEPPTLRLSVVRSSQLSYRPVNGDKRDRTADLLLARQALSQLSYTPNLSRSSRCGDHTL